MNKKSNSVFVTVLVIIIILLLGAVYYFAEVKPQQMVASEQASTQEQSEVVSQTQTTSNHTQSPSTTTGNYSGNGFVVAYPASNVTEDNTSYIASLGAKAIDFYNGDPKSTTSDTELNYIVYIKDGISDNQTLDTYTRDLIKKENGHLSFQIDEKTIAVAGRTGIQFSYQAVAGGYDGTVYVTSVVHDNKAYIIQFIGASVTTADYMKFVSSFSFQ